MKPLQIGILLILAPLAGLVTSQDIDVDELEIHVSDYQRDSPRALYDWEIKQQHAVNIEEVWIEPDDYVVKSFRFVYEPQNGFSHTEHVSGHEMPGTLYRYLDGLRPGDEIIISNVEIETPDGDESAKLEGATFEIIR